jgi:hypothetical protein
VQQQADSLLRTTVPKQPSSGSSSPEVDTQYLYLHEHRHSEVLKSQRVRNQADTQAVYLFTKVKSTSHGTSILPTHVLQRIAQSGWTTEKYPTVGIGVFVSYRLEDPIPLVVSSPFYQSQYQK